MRTSSGKAMTVDRSYFRNFKEPASNGQTFATDLLAQEEERRENEDFKWKQLKAGSIVARASAVGDCHVRGPFQAAGSGTEVEPSTLSAAAVLENSEEVEDSICMPRAPPVAVMAVHGSTMTEYTGVDWEQPNPWQQTSRMDRSCQCGGWCFPCLYLPGYESKASDLMSALTKLETDVPSVEFTNVCNRKVASTFGGQVVRMKKFDPFKDHEHFALQPVWARWRDQPHATGFLGSKFYDPTLDFAVEITLENLQALFDGQYKDDSFGLAYRINYVDYKGEAGRLTKRQRQKRNRSERKALERQTKKQNQGRSQSQHRWG